MLTELTKYRSPRFRFVALLGYLALIVAAFTLASISGWLFWLIILLAPIDTWAMSRNRTLTQRRAEQLGDDLRLLLEADFEDANSDDSRKACADRILASIAWAPADDVRAALTQEQYAAIEEHAQERRLSRTLQLCTWLGKHYFMVMLLALTLVFFVILIFMPQSDEALRIAAATSGVVAISVICTAFAFHTSEKPSFIMSR